jgi:hypothetical protein
MDTRRYFAIGDREDLDYRAKLAEYRRLADEYFEAERYAAFVDEHLGWLDEVAHEYFTSPEFDTVLVETVQSTFPEHEHEHFIAHYRGLLEAWAKDQE